MENNYFGFLKLAAVTTLVFHIEAGNTSVDCAPEAQSATSQQQLMQNMNACLFIILTICMAALCSAFRKPLDS